MQLTLATLSAIAIALGSPAQGAVVPVKGMQQNKTHAVPHPHAPASVAHPHARSEQTLEARDLPPALAGVLGLIDGLLGGVLNSTDGLLANLLLVQQEANGAQPSSYIMAASLNSSTPVYMVQNPGASVNAAANEVPVTIHVPMYDEVESAMVDRCLVYDPMPEISSTISAAPCNSDSADVHASQDFLYNTATSVVSPVFTDAASPPAAANSTLSTVNGTIGGAAPSAAYIIDAALPSAGNATASAVNSTSSSILIVFAPTTSILLSAPDMVDSSTGTTTSPDGTDSGSGDENDDGNTDGDFSDAATYNDSEECSS